MNLRYLTLVSYQCSDIFHMETLLNFLDQYYVIILCVTRAVEILSDLRFKISVFRQKLSLFVPLVLEQILAFKSVK